MYSWRNRILQSFCIHEYEIYLIVQLKKIHSAKAGLLDPRSPEINTHDPALKEVLSTVSLWGLGAGEGGRDVVGEMGR